MRRREIKVGRLYGYARVSTREQNLDRQLSALRDFGIEGRDIFSDKSSGRDFERPAWRRLMRRLAAGDVLVVKSIDRLGRNYEEILAVWRLITKERRAAIVVLDMPILDTRREADGITAVLIGDIVLQLLSYVAQVERENTHQRQAEGIAAARARGVRFGRPRKPRPPCYCAVKESYLGGSITRKEASSQLGVCVSTFDRWLKEDARTGEKSVARESFSR